MFGRSWVRFPWDAKFFFAARLQLDEHYIFLKLLVLEDELSNGSHKGFFNRQLFDKLFKPGQSAHMKGRNKEGDLILLMDDFNAKTASLGMCYEKRSSKA